ncbi:MAG: hypothetical protein PHY40_03565 [Patescibacteria group bacterium]|nr:hypothetical protein [Patescibacteria group bacterium]
MKKSILVVISILIFSFSFVAFSQPILFEGCDEQGYVRCTPDNPPAIKAKKSIKVVKRATPRLDKLEKEIKELGEDDLLMDFNLLRLEKRVEGLEIALTAEQESRQISDENLAEIRNLEEKRNEEKRNIVVYNKIYQHHPNHPINLELGIAGGLTPAVGCYEDRISIFEEVGVNLSLTFPLGNSKWVGKATGYIGLSPTVGLGWGGFFSTLRQFGKNFRIGPAIGGLVDSGILAGTRSWNAGGGIEIGFIIKNRLDLGVIGLVGINGEAVDANKGDYDLGWVVLPFVNFVLF